MEGSVGVGFLLGVGGSVGVGFLLGVGGSVDVGFVLDVEGSVGIVGGVLFLVIGFLSASGTDSKRSLV